MPTVKFGSLSPVGETSNPHNEEMTGPALGNKAILNEIIRRLETRGVHVSVQPAITTSSYYLTFDFGVLKKARVGDHTGKGYNYSYEIGGHFSEYKTIPQQFKGRTFSRRVYPSTHVGQLVKDVLTLKASMVSKYGESGYNKVLEKKRAEA
jgi:hypothetical protein